MQPAPFVQITLNTNGNAFNSYEQLNLNGITDEIEVPQNISGAITGVISGHFTQYSKTECTFQLNKYTCRLTLFC